MLKTIFKCACDTLCSLIMQSNEVWHNSAINMMTVEVASTLLEIWLL